jgi:hypothetical protein
MLTPRIRACLAAGSHHELLKVLATWKREDLEALHRDIHHSYYLALIIADDEFRDRLNKCPTARRAKVEAAYLKEQKLILEVYGELHQAVQFYLQNKTPEVLQ